MVVLKSQKTSTIKTALGES